MRKTLLFAALRSPRPPPRLSCRSACAQACRSRPGRSRPFSRGSTRCAPILRPNPAARRFISAPSSVGLGAPARPILAAQAAWLRRHPEVVVRVEGYGDGGDTRDHALAVGARRAEEARDYLVLLGVPAAQVVDHQLGQGTAGPGRAVTVLVR